MINNLRYELSFKNILQLEEKLDFYKSNNINKINIPCKGVIKKEFLNNIVEFIGEKYNNFNVIYHYSLYHQYTKNKESSYLKFLNFIKKCNSYSKSEILLVSGSNKRKNFEVLDVLRELKNEKELKVNLGIAYNPYLENYYKISGERLRIQEKISSGLIKSIWFQFGTDIKLLESEIKFLKETLPNYSSNKNYNSVKFFGSLLIPSKQFISRFRFRPWKEVFISDEYLDSLDDFYAFTRDLIECYLDNNIRPVIETESTSIRRLEDISNLLKQ